VSRLADTVSTPTRITKEHMETIDMLQELAGRHCWYRTVPVLYHITVDPAASYPSPLRIPTSPTQDPAAKRLREAVNTRIAEIRAAGTEQFMRMYRTAPLSHILLAEIPTLSGVRSEGIPVRVLMSVVDEQLLLLQRTKGQTSFFRTADDGRGNIDGLTDLEQSLQELENAVQVRIAEAVASR
jgi:hypothetical protein